MLACAPGIVAYVVATTNRVLRLRGNCARGSESAGCNRGEAKKRSVIQILVFLSLIHLQIDYLITP